ncbi:hypothetical protein DFH06DRAFT_1332220 [Mycena polygramma]|nr:hypothetical protein DFH06DRAFT_1339941 [Mycena polygramma]KAJ7648609.1 hypothetical protein DFH06DRAFT_1332220 [Mycena polygramma]
MSNVPPSTVLSAAITDISGISANRPPRHFSDFIPLMRSLIAESNTGRAGAKPCFVG